MLICKSFSEYALWIHPGRCKCCHRIVHKGQGATDVPSSSMLRSCSVTDTEAGKRGRLAGSRFTIGEKMNRKRQIDRRTIIATMIAHAGVCTRNHITSGSCDEMTRATSQTPQCVRHARPTTWRVRPRKGEGASPIPLAIQNTNAFCKGLWNRKSSPPHRKAV